MKSTNGRTQSKHDYSKPELKQRIDDAMAAFINSGKAVQRIAAVRVPDPLDEVAGRAANGNGEADGEEEAAEGESTAGAGE